MPYKSTKKEKMKMYKEKGKAVKKFLEWNQETFSVNEQAEIITGIMEGLIPVKVFLNKGIDQAMIALDECRSYINKLNAIKEKRSEM
jgi:hypothetical protein